MPVESLGDYRIIKELDVGVLGQTLLAEHRFIKKYYTLHLLPPALCADRGFIDRFTREVSRLALLRHPHLIPVHTVSVVDETYFLVSDYEGDIDHAAEDLSSYLSHRKEPCTEEVTLSILRAIASALDYAHREGVSHQALSLHAILVREKKGGVEIYLRHLGVAAVCTPGILSLSTFKTIWEEIENRGLQPGYILPPVGVETMNRLSRAFLQGYSFLAPEQKRCERVGAPADVYAFGILAYFLLSGTFPEGVFALPSTFIPSCHHQWDRLVTSCLQAEAAKRPLQLLPLFDTQPERAKEALFDTPISLESIRPPALSHLEREESTIQRVMQRVVEQLPVIEPISEQTLAMASAAVNVGVELKEAHTATSDALYAQQLNAMLNRDPVITQYQPLKKESRNIEPLQTEMIIIPGGSFLRGSNNGNRDEGPKHKVHLKSFAVDIHPVSNEQFLRFLECTGGEKDHNYNDLIRLKDSRLSRCSGRLSIESGYARHPVVGVTWYGALGYASWIGKRLPTEAEWEIAVRGGNEGALYPTGETIEKSQANFFSSDTTPVMSYPPNAYGLYDMAGNVYEWCHDWYGYTYYETSLHEPHAPKGPPQGVYRVLRGGCWKSLQDDMRCSHRHRNNPGTVNSTYGFRCAADIE